MPELVAIAPGTFAYREAGEFLRDGNPVDAPLTDVAFQAPPAFMKRQVSRAEYERCAAVGACRPLGEPAGDAPETTPATGLSWNDATAYAAWLSAATGQHFRLPSDAEWAYAARDVFRDDALGAQDGADPSKRWIAAYERESAEGALDVRPLPFGSFGTSTNGLQDLGGNVWEWTDSCYVRHSRTNGVTGALRELRRAGRGGQAPHLSQRLHPRCAGRRLLGRRPARQSRRAPRPRRRIRGAELAVAQRRKQPGFLSLRQQLQDDRRAIMFRTFLTATIVACVIAAAGVASAAEFEVKMLNKGAKGAMVFEPDFLKVAPGDTVKFVADRQEPQRRIDQGDDPGRRDAVRGKAQ